MKYLALLALSVFVLLHLACLEGDWIDSKITEEEALAQNYDLITPIYGVRVAIRDDVKKNPEDILDLLIYSTNERLIS